MLQLESQHAGNLWFQLLYRLYADGKLVQPRGFETREILNVTLRLEDSLNCIFIEPTRNLSYRFMVAEWLWIQFGRDDVATISRYNKHIAQFSDNGIDFNGSYGRPISAQWNEVLNNLVNDEFSRQAVISIFGSQRSRHSKDVPCTISLQFIWREGKLHTTAVMRSSDVWLGLPYDMHNFAMMGNVMAAQLRAITGKECDPGSLTMHLGSSHLYDRNYVEAAKINYDPQLKTSRAPRLEEPPPLWLEKVLITQEFMDGREPWGRFAQVLTARTNAEALNLLR